MPQLEALETKGACHRCGSDQGIYRVRSDLTCGQCLIQFVTTKTVKRMETYGIKVSGNLIPRKLLLPLSFGASSASLLWILDQHLEGQRNRLGRTAYELLVVHVDLDLDADDSQGAIARLRRYETRFPRHRYSNVTLHQALSLGDFDWNALDTKKSNTAPADTLTEARRRALIESLPSATSRADVLATLLRLLLVDLAKKSGCDSILFGDSTTRLAERTLTETAKGRGFSLPWQVSDGPSPFEVGFNFPLRDLLRKELLTFSSLIAPPLAELLHHARHPRQTPSSLKSTAIDDLMRQYFDSVEENYPSIVANVVRTSSKLDAGTTNAADCSLCGLPVFEGADGIYGWGGDQHPALRQERHHKDGESLLCYGCSRSVTR